MSRAGAIRVAALLAILAAAGGGARAQDPEARYQTLLTAAKAAEDKAAVDWQALRFAYADRPGFTAGDEGDEFVHETAMRQAYAATDYAGALVEAGRLADLDFVDPEVHLIASVAHRKLDERLAAQREQAIAVGLLTSMQTGDGRSTAGAFTAISVKEEHVLIAAHGWRVGGQARIQEGGHAYDVVQTLDKTGATATLYFQADRIVAAESHVLSLPRAK